MEKYSPRCHTRMRRRKEADKQHSNIKLTSESSGESMRKETHEEKLQHNSVTLPMGKIASSANIDIFPLCLWFSLCCAVYNLVKIHQSKKNVYTILCSKNGCFGNQSFG